MFKSPIAMALVIGGLLVTTACASSTATTAASGSPSASTSSTATPSAPAGSSASPSPSAGSTLPASAACGGATPVAGPVVRVTNSDDGKQLCVSRGDELVVLLLGSLASKWIGIHSSSTSVLTPATYPGMTLEVGWTGAAFHAARPGTAYISASRYPCGSTSPHPLRVVCGVIIGYHVDVVVVS